jgi:hypothetical protein
MASPRDSSALATTSVSNIFKIGDRVAVIHLEDGGKKHRREVERIDTVEMVTPKYIITDHAQFSAETGVQMGSAPLYQIVSLAPEHEVELKRAARRKMRSDSQK